MADYRPYIERQDAVAALWRTPGAWACQSSVIVARMGRFSSGRSIREYCQRVWQIPIAAEAG